MVKKGLILIFVLFAIGFGFGQKKEQVIFFFETNSYSFSASETKKIDSLIAVLKQNKKYYLTLEGNTDKTGSKDFNKKLAQERANAVYQYLIQNGIQNHHFKFVGDQNIVYISNDDSKNRNTILHIDFLDFKFDTSNKTESTIESSNGIKVTAYSNGTSNLSINDYYSAENMMNEGINAIDVDGNVLKSDGMFQICDQEKRLNETGEFYLVKMPSRSEQVIDTKMTVWLDIEDEIGTVLWKQTEIEITTDETKKFYLLKVPKTSKKCIRINLDKICIFKNNCETFYVATFKNFNFKDIRIPEASFSAKINDSLFVFTKDLNKSILKSTLYGKIEMNDKETNIHFNIKDCKLIRKKNKPKEYFLEEKSPYTIGNKKYNEILKSKPKKGFFTWLKSLFS